MDYIHTFFFVWMALRGLLPCYELGLDLGMGRAWGNDRSGPSVADRVGSEIFKFCPRPGPIPWAGLVPPTGLARILCYFYGFLTVLG